MTKLSIGCHLSSSKGFAAMGKTALKIDATTFAYFTRNPRGGNAKKVDDKDIAALQQILDTHDMAKLVVHAPYTYNLCSSKLETREFARRAFAEDLQTLELLPGQYLNFHPGAHTGQGADVGIELIAQGLNEVMFDGMHTKVLLETMAGKGTEVGRSFEELAAIIERCDFADNLGVCLDTCHVHDAGYDIVNNLDGVLEEFDRVIGLKRLCALHINDSKNPREAHKDRHELIGEGYIGIDTMRSIVNHPYLQTLPMILETPNELDGYAQEIALLRSVHLSENDGQ